MLTYLINKAVVTAVIHLLFSLPLPEKHQRQQKKKIKHLRQGFAIPYATQNTLVKNCVQFT